MHIAYKYMISKISPDICPPPPPGHSLHNPSPPLIVDLKTAYHSTFLLFTLLNNRINLHCKL